MKLFIPKSILRAFLLSLAAVLLGVCLAGCCCTIPVSLITRVTEDKQEAIKNTLAPDVQQPDQQVTEPSLLPVDPTIPLPDTEEPEEPAVVSCTWHGLTYSVGSEYSTEFNDGYAYHAKAEANITVEYYEYNGSYTEPLEYLEDHVQQMTAMGNECQIYDQNGVFYVLVHWWYGHQEIRAIYMMDGYVLTIHGRTSEYSEEIPALIDYVTSGKVISDQVSESTATIYVRVPADWSVPNCYAWTNESGQQFLDSWPGRSMTPGEDFFELQVPSWVDYVIISNDDSRLLTEDIAIRPGEDVWIIVNGERNNYYLYYQSLYGY